MLTFSSSVSGTETAFIPNAISMSAVWITGCLKVGEISVHSEGGALKAGDRCILNDDRRKYF